ncbi:hypothetical protein AWZ03_006252 [Drosophila navojoa]|uniref:Uncharacterized protein n=1 Tax=Drosophila navojoa TaxID=7232 RepID=A0A484BEU9_DRONA|nr:hypothetical protein AWZ03_006252 [Drosophila navojoa]
MGRSAATPHCRVAACAASCRRSSAAKLLNGFGVSVSIWQCQFGTSFGRHTMAAAAFELRLHFDGGRFRGTAWDMDMVATYQAASAQQRRLS